MYDKHLFETVTFHGQHDLARILDLRSASGIELVWIDVDIGSRTALLLWRKRDASAQDALAQIFSIMPVMDPATTGFDMSDAYKIKTFDSIREILRAKLFAPITGET